MNTKPTKKIGKYETRPDIIKTKRLTGMIYGIVSGLTFAITTWGRDGYTLAQSHAYLPWLSLGIASVLCAAVGAATGWLAARTENSLFSTILWLIGALFFAWLVIALPLQIAPFVVSKINPELGELLNYKEESEFSLRFGVALMWIVPFVLIVGVAQMSITETSAFSTSTFGRVIPFFFCVVVMGMSGAFTDNLINAPFRSAIVSIDNTIQFVLDNQNNTTIDKTLMREMRAKLLNTVQEYVVKSRYLFVRSYDKTLGDIHVLIKFDKGWVDCEVIYSQPVFCKTATEK